MEDRLKPCPFCGGEDVKILYFTSVLCRGICNVCGASGHVSEVPAEAIEQWNCRAPLYSPVKPEDVIPGYYWLVTPDGEKTIEQIWDGYGHGALGMESPEGWVAVSEIYELGGVLYSIPPLEVAE